MNRPRRAVSRELSTDGGEQLRGCSSATFAYSIIIGNDRVQSYRIMIKDTDFALASHKLDEDAAKDAAQKERDAEIERLKQTGGAAPRL